MKSLENMNNSNNILNKIIKYVLTITLNLIIGGFALIGFLTSYSCFTETDKGIDNSNIGFVFGFITLIIVFVPNILIYNKTTNNKFKCFLIQLLSLIVGAVICFLIKKHL